MKPSHLVTTAAATFAALTAQAGMLNPADWNASMSTNDNSYTMIDNPNSSAIRMTYWFNSYDVYGGVSSTFTTTATQSGALTLDWSYQFWHQWYMTSASLTFFANSASGVVETTVFSASPAYQGTYVTGTTTLNLSQGYSWGVRVTGSNMDSNTAISGIVALTPVPTPGALALLGATGLAGSRRRRAIA